MRRRDGSWKKTSLIIENGKWKIESVCNFPFSTFNLQFISVSGNIFSNWKKRITQYIEVRVQLIKLGIIERISNILGSFIFVLMAMFLLCLVLIFAGFGVAEAFSAWFDSRIGGYFAASGVYVLFIAGLVLFRRPLLVGLSGIFIRMLTSDDDDDDDLPADLKNNPDGAL